MEMRWGTPTLIAMAVVIVMAVAAYIGYTNYGIGMSSDDWQRTVFARHEVKVVVRTLKLPSNIEFPTLTVVKHSDGGMVLCGAYSFAGANHDLDPPTPFYAAGPLVVALGIETPDFMAQFNRYCKENGEPT